MGKEDRMKKIIDKVLKAVAFQSGNCFRFPDDNTVYEFWYLEYTAKGDPVVRYYDENGNGKARVGFHLSDLTRC